MNSVARWQTRGLLAAGVALLLVSPVPTRAADFAPTPEQAERLTQFAGTGPVALVYHAEIADRRSFDWWQQSVRESAEQAGGRRVYTGDADPAAWEGMRFDVIWVDELPTRADALAALRKATATAGPAVNRLSVLAIDPLPAIVPMLARWVGALLRFIAPIEIRDSEGSGLQETDPKHAAIWANAETVQVAREQDPKAPLFVYNLNKLREHAAYDGPIDEDPNVSGAEAYRRYGGATGILRRGGYPFFFGSVVGHVAGTSDEPLADEWSHFILVYYPERRAIFSMVESPEYRARAHHRNAGLERASLRFTAPWAEFDPR